ncbi:uncharacterized protein [Mytilus edulis]|uniref:uncharacterized protein n=1 Tax=Mytilus edulis TaxID=6550 RepID=UPI0039EEE57D
MFKNENWKVMHNTSTLLQVLLVFTESSPVNDYAYSVVGDTALLNCKTTLGSNIIALQWLRLNPSKNVTESTYTDGSIVNEEIQHHNRISTISSLNGTSYDLQIVNVTESDAGEYRCVSVTGKQVQHYDVRLIVQEEMSPSTTVNYKAENSTKSTHYMETENEDQSFDITTLSTDLYKNTTDENVTKLNEQAKYDTDFQNEAIYWVVGMVGSGVVVFITVFLSYIYLKKLNDIVKNANQGHTMSIEYREEQTNNIGNDNIEIYETSENVRENKHARSATRIERRTINNEVYEIVQQDEPSPNIQMEHLTQDEGNRTYQTVSADLSNDDHIYKELSDGQC